MCASIGTCACPAESRHTEVLQQRFPEVSDCLIKIDPHCRHWSLPSMPMVKQVNQPFPFSITCHLKSSLYFIKLSHSMYDTFQSWISTCFGRHSNPTVLDRSWLEMRIRFIATQTSFSLNCQDVIFVTEAGDYIVQLFICHKAHGK